MTNLSWKDTKENLEFLESTGFVRVVKGEYKITERGLEAIQAFEIITNTLSPKLKVLNPKVKAT